MDNEKTGNLIRSRRKEMGMTQLDLAQQLGITDRAVSKWERGLCAPDIALLEPLAEALGTTVIALVTGEPEAPVAVEPVLEYSAAEMTRKQRAWKGKTAAVLLAAALLVLMVNGLRGEGFVLRCIPAWGCAWQGAQALEGYDEAAILRCFADAEEMYPALVALEDRGIRILDAKAELSRIRLEDGFLTLELQLLVAYDGLEYRLTCPGTYYQGKVALMQIRVPSPPEWISDLSDALATYDPG